MRPSSRRRWSRPNERRFSAAHLLLVLLLAGVGIGVLYNRSRLRGGQDPATNAAASVLAPAQTAAARANESVGTTARGLFGGVAVERENVRLREELARLRLENDQLRGAAAERDLLKRTIDYLEGKETPPKVAEVVAWLPTSVSETITVAAGSRNGVERNAAVRTDAGLVGRVVDVGPITARIRLLTDTDSRVSAKVIRDGKTVGQGIVHGEGRDRDIVLRNLKPESDVRAGDLVVTFGDGGIFPPDIPIGTVTEVALTPSRIERTARLTMDVPPPGDLRHVLILPLAPPEPEGAPKPGKPKGRKP